MVVKNPSFLMGIAVFLGIKTDISVPWTDTPRARCLEVSHFSYQLRLQLEQQLHKLSYRLIWINALAKLPPIKEVLQQLLHLGNSGRTTGKNNSMDAALIHPSITQALLHNIDTLPEQFLNKSMLSSTNSWTNPGRLQLSHASFLGPFPLHQSASLRPYNWSRS